MEPPNVLLTDIPLHPGEVEAISLAHERQLPILIEEYDGRNTAHAKGLQVSGIAGQILKGRHQKIITTREAVAFMDQLLDARRINTTLHRMVLDMIP